MRVESPPRAGEEAAGRGCGLCRAQFQPLPRSQVWEWGEGHRRGEEKQTRSFKRLEVPSFHIPATEFPSCPRAGPPYCTDLNLWGRGGDWDKLKAPG